MATTAPQEQETGAPAAMAVEDGVAVIRLDQPGKPVNVISAALLETMDGILRRLEAGEARSAVIVSEKPGVWIAGADIEQFEEFRVEFARNVESHLAPIILDRPAGVRTGQAVDRAVIEA